MTTGEGAQQKDVLGIDLKGTYNENDLDIQEKRVTKEKIEISYCQIYGLKDKIIQDNNRKKVDTFTKACNAIRKNGIEIKDKQANQKDLKEWNGILSKIREKYKVIIIDADA